MIRAILVLTGWLVATAPALAQQATLQNPLLDHLAGHWVMTGTIADQPTTHDIDAVWVLEHQYLQLHEVSREKRADGAPSYEALVHIGWDATTKHYVCAWLDDYGSISTQSLGYASPNGDHIAFVFQNRDDAGKFHTTFTYDAAHDSWAMDMDNDADGKRTAFARTTLTRAGGGD